MREHIKEFFHRGLLAAVGGPVVLVIIYLCVQGNGNPIMLTVNEVALGILTSALLAFIAAGISVIYKIENLPLMWAIFIHLVVLYLDYVIIYLVNGWMERDLKVILMFTLCFVGGYAIVWTMIYFFAVRPSIRKMNRKLQEEMRV